MCSATISPGAPVNGVEPTKSNGIVVVTELEQHSSPIDAEQETLQAPLPNPSLVVTADHQLKAEEAPVLAPKYGEALVHVKATGVCG